MNDVVSWKPEMLVDGGWAPNGVAFATEAEAMTWASNLALHWTAVREYRVVPSDQPVNYRLDKFGRAEAVG